MSIRDEARREYVRGAIGPSVGTIADRLGDAWEAGAEWQASREPTDAEVEAAAKALFSEIFKSVPDVTWESVSENVRNNYRVKAYVTLRAARETQR